MTKCTLKNSAGEVLSEENSSYDAAGNITDVPCNCFSYDINNRLVSFNGQNLTNDADGNMLSAAFENGTYYFSYDSASRLISTGTRAYTYNAEKVRPAGIKTTILTAAAVLLWYLNCARILRMHLSMIPTAG